MFICHCANPACQLYGCMRAREICPIPYAPRPPEFAPKDPIPLDPEYWRKIVERLASPPSIEALEKRIEELEKKLADKEPK